MANKTIPLQDKQLVVERIAQGMSTREAIDGTAIQSNSTAAQLAKQQSDVIAQYRKDYLFAIEHQTGANKAERAKMWGAMIYATKPAVTNYYEQRDETTGKVTMVPLIDNIPDWRPTCGNEVIHPVDEMRF